MSRGAHSALLTTAPPTFPRPFFISGWTRWIWHQWSTPRLDTHRPGPNRSAPRPPTLPLPIDAPWLQGWHLSPIGTLLHCPFLTKKRHLSCPSFPSFFPAVSAPPHFIRPSVQAHRRFTFPHPDCLCDCCQPAMHTVQDGSRDTRESTSEASRQGARRSSGTARQAMHRPLASSAILLHGSHSGTHRREEK